MTATTETVLNDACLAVIAAIRFGQKVGRTVPTSVLAQSLQVAVESAADLETAS